METLLQTKTRLEAFLKEAAPSIDLSPGSVLSELLSGLTASAQNELFNQISSISSAKTVQDALTSAVDTFSPTIDALASNFNTYRNQGSKANGNIKIVVNKARSYFIPKGTTFIQPNLLFQYATIVDYTIPANSTTLTQSGTTFNFIVAVQALEIGQDKQVSNGTQFALSSVSSIPEFISASALGAFNQGLDKESDKELITRFRLGLSARNLVSPNAIQAVLTDIYPNFRSVSVIGANDPEQLRGSGNPFGIVLPGMVDVHLRMCNALPTTTITLTGTHIISGPDTGKWTVTVPATAVPGFYKILSIIKSGGIDSGTQTFSSVSYGFDTVSYTTKNIINNASQARFTKYQTCVVIFDYTSANTTEKFDLTMLYQPDIANVQAMFLDNETRIPCADYLVKGIVPCNASVSLKLVKNNSLDTVDLTSIKSDIFSYINSLPIGESISASRIIDICHNYNIKRVDLPIILKGSILMPYAITDQSIYLTGTDTLDIPDLPSLGITKNTTTFFTNYFDENGNETIGISIS